MAQHFSRPPWQTPPQPFAEAPDPASPSGLFWARLLAYRPLFLLGGLWLAMVFVSAIAYHGLMFNEPVEDTTYREAPLSLAAPPPQDFATTPEVDPVDVAAPPSATVTLWGLFSLVGLCGFGCFVLTQQIKASARPKRKKARPMALARSPQPKRLAPYSPKRDGVVVPGARVVEAVPYAAPRPGAPAASPAAAVSPTRTSATPRPISTAKPQVRPQAVGQPSPAGLAVAQLHPHTPAVVPDEADLALDWSEGSVAHALDVRQRRSLSSFM